MYEIVAALEQQLERQVDLVVQVGDFGVWPNPDKLDEATRRHGGAGDFPRWLAERRAAPRPTLFIPGNHEDFEYLGSLEHDELLPNLRLLPWAGVVELEGLRIGGLGGCYSSRSYAMKSLSGRRRRHYCKEEVRQLSRAGRLDLLLIHDAPAGRFQDIRPDWPRAWTTHAEGLAELVEATRPQLCLHGHLHGRFERRLGGVPVSGLTAVPWAGCAIVFEIAAGDRGVQVVAEWSRTPSWGAHVDQALAAAPPVDVRPLVDLLDEWRDAVLAGATLDRHTRKRLYPELPARAEARRVLMAALGGQALAPLLDGLLDAGWSEAELHRLVDSRPDPARLRARLG